jgi:hypothetical protein
MPAATAEELQAQLTKAEEEKAAAIKRADDAEAALAKAGEGEGSGESKKPKGGVDSDAEEQEARKEETVKAEKKAAKKAAKEAARKAADLSKADLPDTARAAVEKAEAERDEAIAKAEKKADKAEGIAKAEREIRVGREFVAKAEAFEALPIGKAEDFGPVLKAVHEKLDKADADALDVVLKAADEQIKKGELFKEMGRGGQPEAGDAFSKMQKAAEDIKKAEPSLTADQAMSKAMSANPDLQSEYLAEVR